MSSDETTFFRTRWPHVFLWGLVLLVQGAMVFNRGQMWDSWIYSTQLKEGAWKALRAPFADAGYPLQAYLLWPFSWTPDPDTAARLVSLVILAVSASLLFAAAKRFGFITPAESFVVAVVFVVFPGNTLFSLLIMFPVLVSLGAFWAAVALDLHVSSWTGWKNLVARAISLSLFWISFTWRSFLVFQWAYICLRVWRDSDGSLFERVKRLVKSRPDLIALGPVYFIVQRFLFPQAGRYSDYNTFKLSPSTWIRHMLTYAYRVWLEQIGRGVQVMTIALPFVLAVAIAVVLVLVLKSKERDPKLQVGALVLATLGAFFFASFPYAVVGKSPELELWTLRHALLAPIPLGLSLVLLLRLAGRTRVGYRVGLVAFGFMVAVLVAQSVERMLVFQSRALRERGIVLEVPAQQDIVDCTLVYVEDHVTPKTEEPRRYYEWSAMFHEALGGYSHLGLDRRMDDETFFVKKRDRLAPEFFLSPAVLKGCTAQLDISHGMDGRDHEVGLAALRASALEGKDAFDALAKRSVTLTTQRLGEHSIE